jgi:hypothetical protein
VKNKSFMAAIVIAAFFISLVAGMHSVKVAKANPYWGVYPAEPTQDKPILVIESPGNFSTCTEGNVTFNLTIIKPSSWNMTLAPFGTCANGRIDSVNVSLNGLQEFQEFLYINDLNGGGSWNKSYSLSLGELHFGLNAVEVMVSALALSSSGNYPMNVTSTLYLKYSAISPTPTVSPIITPSPSPTQQPTITPEPTIPKPEQYLPSPFPIGFVLLPTIALAVAIVFLLCSRKRR